MPFPALVTSVGTIAGSPCRSSLSPLLQIIPTRLLVNNIEQRLRTEPSRQRRAHSIIRAVQFISQLY